MNDGPKVITQSGDRIRRRPATYRRRRLKPLTARGNLSLTQPYTWNGYDTLLGVGLTSGENHNGGPFVWSEARQRRYERAANLRAALPTSSPTTERLFGGGFAARQGYDEGLLVMRAASRYVAPPFPVCVALGILDRLGDIGDELVPIPIARRPATTSRTAARRPAPPAARRRSRASSHPTRRASGRQ